MRNCFVTLLGFADSTRIDERNWWEFNFFVINYLIEIHRLKIAIRSAHFFNEIRLIFMKATNHIFIPLCSSALYIFFFYFHLFLFLVFIQNFYFILYRLLEFFGYYYFLLQTLKKVWKHSLIFAFDETVQF